MIIGSPHFKNENGMLLWIFPLDTENPGEDYLLIQETKNYYKILTYKKEIMKSFRDDDFNLSRTLEEFFKTRKVKRLMTLEDFENNYSIISLYEGMDSLKISKNKFISKQNNTSYRVINERRIENIETNRPELFLLPNLDEKLQIEQIKKHFNIKDKETLKIREKIYAKLPKFL